MVIRKTILLALMFSLSVLAQTNETANTTVQNQTPIENKAEQHKDVQPFPTQLVQQFLSIFNDIDNGLLDQVIQKATEGKELLESNKLTSEASSKLKKEAQKALVEVT